MNIVSECLKLMNKNCVRFVVLSSGTFLCEIILDKEKKNYIISKQIMYSKFRLNKFINKKIKLHVTGIVCAAIVLI